MRSTFLLVLASAHMHGSAAHAACDVTTLQAKITSIEESCCVGETCHGGLPDECDKVCAPIFTEFWDSCGSYINNMPNTASFSSFYQQCAAVSPGTRACFPGSRLITVEWGEELAGWVGHGTAEKIGWELCFSSFTMDPTPAVFHQNCDDFSTTLTVAHNEGGTYCGKGCDSPPCVNKGNSTFGAYVRPSSLSPRICIRRNSLLSGHAACRLSARGPWRHARRMNAIATAATASIIARLRISYLGSGRDRPPASSRLARALDFRPSLRAIGQCGATAPHIATTSILGAPARSVPKATATRVAPTVARLARYVAAPRNGARQTLKCGDPPRASRGGGYSA